MAPSGFNVGLVAFIVAILCSGASAQSGCTTALISLSPCLNYITGNATTPTSSCCSQLASVATSEPQCLCTVLNGGGSSLGITINQTQALALPGACNVQTPPASRCNGPSASPTTPSSGSPPASVVPSGSGSSKTVPSVDTNSGSSTLIPFSLVFSLVFFAAAAYISMPLGLF